MKLIYKGKYSGDEKLLPQRDHPEGYRMFREPQDMKKLALWMNLLSLVITVLALAPVVFVTRSSREFNLWDMLGLILPMLAIFPHELLHAICFKGEVELYTNLKQGMCFVIGIEDLTKTRFVLLSLLPNIVFGFIPYAIWVIFPELTFFGLFGAISIGCGAGDYMNVFNCLTQVPKGGLTYMSGMHSYWYMPQ